MKNREETEKISILLAVFEPDMNWLRELLSSLNAQDYPNIELRIKVDGSKSVPFECISSLAANTITAFPYYISKNKKNLGSNKTFESLVLEAEGEYIAFCDQDVIWLPEKLSVLAGMMPGAALSYCDMSVIGGNGVEIAFTLKDIRPRLEYKEGTGLAETYLFRNCTAGCSMLVRSEYAKSAVPFPKNTVCDQWVCMEAAFFGNIAFCPRPLVKYRQHGKNQTGILTSVTCKKDYYECRIKPLTERLAAFDEKHGVSDAAKSFVKARAEKRPFCIYKYRELCRKEAYFEIAAALLPEFAFRPLLKRVKGNG